MELSTSILSDITVYMKYAKYIPELNRRETWEELVKRNMQMHIKKYPQLEAEIKDNYKFVFDKKVLPSMRSMQFAGKPIELSPNRIYNCFSRDTEFISSEGLVSFENFEDGDKVVVQTHKNNWKRATVRSYGVQELNAVTFRRGKSRIQVKATPNHRWLLKDGEETVNLKVGDRILPPPGTVNFDYDNASLEEKLYWCYGFVYGDGTRVKKDGIYQYSMVRLCGDDVKFAYRFEEMGFKSSSSLSLKGDLMFYTGKYLKTEPVIGQDSRELVKAFLDGYLQADGWKNPDWYLNPSLSRYKAIESAHNSTFLRKALDYCGYYTTREEDKTGFETNLGMCREGTVRFSIANQIGRYGWVVESILPVGKEQVWCLEVEDDRSFILKGGLVTGNCAFAPIDDYRVFGEIMFLLLGGTGVGYSVQKHHVEQLPEVRKPNKERTRRYLIADSIEGWADAVKALMKSYYYGGSRINFDFSDIRPKGARLITSGGKAPGPQPLKECLVKVEGILDTKQDGDKITPLEAHDIVCHIADAVLAGGIRRAALISLFSADDDEMIACKSGAWWEENPQRGRSNNSAVLLRHRVEKEFFMELWKRVELSGAGEPGIIFSNDKDWGTNPCAEIALRPYQFCNLTEVNVSDVIDQADFEARVRAASFIGTLQAGYTDFHYLRPVWQRTTEKDALIGVSMTGIGSGAVIKMDMKAGAKVVKEENEKVASILGINKAARTTTVKPAGCQIPSTQIRTSRGDMSLYNIFKVNGVELNSKLDEYREWFEVTEDISVYDEFGNGNKITRLFINGMEETIKFTMEDDSVIECTPNHKFMMVDGSWKEARDITEYDEWLCV